MLRESKLITLALVQRCIFGITDKQAFRNIKNSMSHKNRVFYDHLGLVSIGVILTFKVIFTPLEYILYIPPL